MNIPKLSKSNPKYLTINKGKEILKDIKEQIKKLSKKKYPNLYSYVGKGQILREEILNLLTYLINPHNKTNEYGQIEQRFFISDSGYCFYMDTNAYTDKIRKKGGGRLRSNRALNLLCAIGFFNKDTDPSKYEINQNFKLDTGMQRDLNIFRFTKLNLKDLEENAKRLREKNVSVSNISSVNLKAWGLADIAKRVYFKNKPNAFTKKYREFLVVLKVLGELIEEKGYCTRGQLIYALPYSQTESEKILKAFKQDIEANYRYGRARKEDRAKYNYTASKWIYTRKDTEENVQENEKRKEQKEKTVNEKKRRSGKEI